MHTKEFLKEHGYEPRFSSKVTEQAEAVAQAVEAAELARRRDLTGETIVTIDGADAKDLDDAISISKLRGGKYLLGVHIADVSHYVREGSLVDAEAFARGTSVYLGATVVPMLPPVLSNGICSLNPDEKRLTLSVFMTITKTGNVSDYEICESVIASKARMTYSKVTQILEGNMAARNEYAHLAPTFEYMRELALILRDKRARRGAIDFDFPEAKLVMAKDDTVLDIGIADVTVSNRMIEEFMLVANETVAKHLCENDLPGVFRVHERPEGEKLEGFAMLARGLGYPFKAKKEVLPKQMQAVLFQAADSPHIAVISTMMLRSMMKARYDGENLGHFALAAEHYCHFTAPIRRYADLMVHRILKESLNKKLSARKRKHYDDATRQTAVHVSQMEISAVMAEREYVADKACEFMQDKVGQQYTGVICGVTSFGFFVQLPNLVEGLVRMVDLDDDYYLFDEKRLCLVGKHSGAEYHMGQQIKVQLAKVNTELKQIDFVPVQPPQSKRKKERTRDDAKGRHKEKTRSRSGASSKAGKKGRRKK